MLSPKGSFLKIVETTGWLRGDAQKGRRGYKAAGAGINHSGPKENGKTALTGET
jgi:hypothetical protein